MKRSHHARLPDEEYLMIVFDILTFARSTLWCIVAFTVKIDSLHLARRALLNSTD